MNRRHFLAALAAGVALSSAAQAHEYTLGALTIGHPYAFETPATATTGAGYLSITNNGTAPERLIAVRAAFPRSQIHEVQTDAQGVTRMQPIEALDIPPGATVTLAPQSLHVMFMGLDQPFVAGTTVPATLAFEKAGEIAVEFKVEPRGAGADHEDMPGMTH